MIRLPHTLAASLFLALAGTLCADDAAAPAPLPTMDQIKAEFDAGKWMDCLKLIVKVEPQVSRKDSGFNAYEIESLNAECHIQLKNAENAIRLLKVAENAGTTKADVAKAFATRTLIEKRNAAWQYVPAANKDGDAKNDKDNLDIVDPSKRNDAIKALFNDYFPAIKKNEKNILANRALPPIVAFAAGLTDARKLEFAATGGEKECDAMIAELSKHATTSITNALTDSTRTVDNINRSANENVDYNQTVPDPNNPGRTIQRRVQGRRGLQGNDRNNLNDAISLANQLPPVCRDLGTALGDKGAFTDSLNKANTLGQRAKQTLNADYTRR